MFWLILLALPHHRHYHRHGRFRHPLYWLSGLAFLELTLWCAVIEVAGELLAVWWVLWWASRGLAAAGQAMWEATQPASAGAPDWKGAVDGARPPWPRRPAAQGRP
jgi:hypothetical protein